MARLLKVLIWLLKEAWNECQNDLQNLEKNQSFDLFLFQPSGPRRFGDSEVLKITVTNRAAFETTTYRPISWIADHSTKSERLIALRLVSNVFRVGKLNEYNILMAVI